MESMTKVETWLPIFSGFYSTIWDGDTDEENELYNINETRAEKNLPPIKWDDVEWDYEGYRDAVAKGVAHWIGKELVKRRFISRYEFQALRSPREYNFTNDSIDVAFSLSSTNREVIRKYLKENASKFAEYIAGRYTSYDGFISSYSNDPAEWMAELDEALEHKHKLGSILNFILVNENKDLEMTIYEDLSGNGVNVQAKNYSELVDDQK